MKSTMLPSSARTKRANAHPCGSASSKGSRSAVGAAPGPFPLTATPFATPSPDRLTGEPSAPTVLTARCAPFTAGDHHVLYRLAVGAFVGYRWDHESGCGPDETNGGA